MLKINKERGKASQRSNNLCYCRYLYIFIPFSYYSRFICSQNEVNHEMPGEFPQKIDRLSWFLALPCSLNRVCMFPRRT